MGRRRLTKSKECRGSLYSLEFNFCILFHIRLYCPRTPIVAIPRSSMERLWLKLSIMKPSQSFKSFNPATIFSGPIQHNQKKYLATLIKLLNLSDYHNLTTLNVLEKRMHLYYFHSLEDCSICTQFSMLKFSSSVVQFLVQG